MVKYFIKINENLNNKRFWVAVLIELIATCAFVFVGCGSMLFHFADHESAITSSDIVRAGVATGLTATVIIAALGPASDCHINPAVSIGLLFGGKVTLVRTFFYVIVQIIGALFGAALLYFVLPDDQRHSLGMTTLANGVSPIQGFFAELVMTFILITVISSCIDEKRSDFHSFKSTNSIIIGLTMTALILKGAAYTGCSLNPARSFGPAFLNWKWDYHWIYWCGPIAGATLGALTYRFLLTTHEPVLVTTSSVEEEDTTSSNDKTATINLPSVISDGVYALPPVVPLRHYNNNKFLKPVNSIESDSSINTVSTKMSAFSSTSKVSKISQASKRSAFSLALAPTPFDNYF